MMLRARLPYQFSRSPLHFPLTMENTAVKVGEWTNWSQKCTFAVRLAPSDPLVASNIEPQKCNIGGVKQPMSAKSLQPDLFEVNRISGAQAGGEMQFEDGRFQLLLLSSGASKLLFDNGDHCLLSPCLCWLPNDRARRVVLDPKARGLSISVPETMIGRALPEDVMGEQVSQSIGLFRVMNDLDPDVFDDMFQLGVLMEQELGKNAPGVEVMLQHTLALMLVSIWRLTGAELTQPVPQPSNIVHAFMSLLDVHLRDHWSVEQYADHIGVSRDRLTSLIRRATGEAPLAIIHRKMISEAKLLLTSSGMQVAQIAFVLGFSDPGYFNRFFQRHTGTPPGKFRFAGRNPKTEQLDSLSG